MPTSFVGYLLSTAPASFVGNYGWRVLWLFNEAAALLSLGSAAWLVPKEANDSWPTASSQAGRPDRRLIALIVAYDVRMVLRFDL